MTHIITTSIVRNGMGYLDRYTAQVEGLARALAERGDTFSLVMAEGDSTDGTDVWLNGYASRAPFSVTVYSLPHGGPVFGSVNDKVRWANIAKTWNRLYDQLAGHVTAWDVVVYIETDLVWDAATMLSMIDHVDDGFAAVAPMSFLRGTDVFYDVWGHRGMDGGGFGHRPPYHASLADHNGLVQIRSAGSCMVMRGQVARVCRFAEHDAMLGHSIYEQGFTLWLDPALRVEHA